MELPTKICTSRSVSASSVSWCQNPLTEAWMLPSIILSSNPRWSMITGWYTLVVRPPALLAPMSDFLRRLQYLNQILNKWLVLKSRTKTSLRSCKLSLRNGSYSIVKTSSWRPRIRRKWITTKGSKTSRPMGSPLCFKSISETSSSQSSSTTC